MTALEWLVRGNAPIDCDSERAAKRYRSPADGNSLPPWVQPADEEKRMVTVKPGDVILHHGVPKTVAGVSIYRALPLTAGAEAVG